MAGYAPTPNQQQVDTALVQFLQSILPAAQSGGPMIVVKGQANRVAEPADPNFVVFTAVARPRLATTIDTQDPLGGQTMTATQENEIVYQLDVHGPSSADNAEVISTLFRDQVATTFFEALNIGVDALHADDPRQVPFINENDQYETRWVVEAHLQANQVVTAIPQQSATAAKATLINVDATYPG